MNSGVQVSKDGRNWRIGAAADVDWIAGHTTAGISITTAIPPVFDAYATTTRPTTSPPPPTSTPWSKTSSRTPRTSPGGWATSTPAPTTSSSPTPRRCRSTGAGRTCWSRPAPSKPSPGGPVTCATPEGALPDLFFPADRSWLVSALWDDTWTCVGGPAPLIHTLERDPLANARRVRPDEDALPPGLTRE